MGFDAINQSLLSDDLSASSSDFSGDEKKLKDLARTIDKALLGITAYAGALNNLVESGNTGEKNASQVANSLTQIVDLIAPATASSIVKLTAEEASKLYGQIAKVRAAKSLKIIMDEASPTIKELRSNLGAMVNELIRYNRIIYQIKRNNLIRPDALSKYSIDYDNYLKREQIKIFEKLSLISQYKSDTEDVRMTTFAKLKEIDPIVIKEEKDIEPRQAALVIQSIRIDSELHRIKPINDAVKVTQKRIVDEYNLIDQLFKKSNDALATWEKAHSDIRQQVEKKQLPNFQELISVVDDLKELREKIKALNP
ncbi:hypothetical protein [Spirosoma daeguense]